MGATYARILQKISSIRTNMSLAQRVFKWIICAKRPLLITELTEAIAFQPNDRSWDADKIPDASRTIQACKNLVVLDETDKTVRLAHHSVQKFLLEPPTQESIPEFHFERSRANNEVGELCVAYLSFSDFERQLTTSTPNFCRLTGEVAGPSAIIESVISSPTSGHVTSYVTRMRQRMGKGVTTKQPSIVEFPKLVKLRKPAPLSLLEKHLFLKYAVENWIGHTSDFSNHNRRAWSLFKDLAMDKPMPFDIRVWGDMHESNDLPYTGLFRWAANAGHVPLLRLLLELPPGSDLPAYCRQEDDRGQSVVLNASRHGHANVIELLAQRGLVDNFAGESFLEAVEKGHDKVVRVLLHHPALCSEFIPETLRRATECGHVAIVHLLLDAIPFIDLDSDFGELSLLAAVEHGLLLLSRKGTRAGTYTGVHDTFQRLLDGNALHQAAKQGFVGVAALLLENGADVNKRNGDNETALHLAARYGQHRVVQLLLYNEASIEARDANTWIVLHMAATDGYEEDV